MVALSVSTSASESSDFTVSPTLKFHLLITPSVMVSLNAGIRMTVAGILDLSTLGFASFEEVAVAVAEADESGAASLLLLLSATLFSATGAAGASSNAL